jgi:hypothetical protein
MKKWIIPILVLALALAALYMVIGKKAADEGVKAVNTYQGFATDAQKSVDELNKSAKQTEDALKSINGKR